MLDPVARFDGIRGCDRRNSVTSATDPIRAVGLAGSLRQESFNRKLLAAAVELAPPQLHIEPFDALGDLPFYNEDVAAHGDPAAVTALKSLVANSDALIVATPEYNFGVPGVLKNALDWLSLPPGRSPLSGKTAAIMGASPGMLGTARAQLHLRQLFIFTRTHAVLQPEILVAHAGDAFDDDGRLTDPLAQKLLGKQLERLVDLTIRLR